jgi:hypothetical protein
MLVIERSGDDSKPTVGVCHVRFRSHRHRALPVLVAFGHGAGLAAGLGTPHPVLGVPAGCPQDPLHHQFQRVVQLSAAEDHLKPWPFPPRRAVVKLPWVAIRDIEDNAPSNAPKQARRPRTYVRGRLVEGAQLQGWNATYGALSLPSRLDPRAPQLSYPVVPAGDGNSPAPRSRGCQCR